MEQELGCGGDDYQTEFPEACDHPEHQTWVQHSDPTLETKDPIHDETNSES